MHWGFNSSEKVNVKRINIRACAVKRRQSLFVNQILSVSLSHAYIIRIILIKRIYAHGHIAAHIITVIHTYGIGSAGSAAARLRITQQKMRAHTVI